MASSSLSWTASAPAGATAAADPAAVPVSLARGGSAAGISAVYARSPSPAKLTLTALGSPGGLPSPSATTSSSSSTVAATVSVTGGGAADATGSASGTAAAATLWGVPLSLVSLVTLVVQARTLLIMKYSTIVTGSGPRYLASTAVLMSELTKLVVCFAIHSRDEARRTGALSLGRMLGDLFGRDSDCLKMLVPAALYVVQNNLQYMAVANLDPATFQVSYQMKILTTALFSVWLLRRSLSRQKWLSLFLLTAGIALVQLPTQAAPAASAGDDDDAASAGHTGLQKFVGLVAVSIACLSSGLAGVWFEKVLKGSKASLWARNIQLSQSDTIPSTDSFFSLIPALFIGVLVMDGAKVAEDGFFQGYTFWTWAAIACQAIGGLIVALVVKYADNILKGFATSISIILSAVASVFIFDFKISLAFVIGAVLVLY
ncbi:hypothetical protein HK405_011810, partial [Cladochytrium tenue]